MKINDELDRLRKEKDSAYWERNQLVAALSKVFPAWLGKHPKEDKDWEDDWRTIVYIRIPIRDKAIPEQVSWHIHDKEIQMFDHLKYEDRLWDGHDTEEKYRRLRQIIPRNE